MTVMSNHGLRRTSARHLLVLLIVCLTSSCVGHKDAKFTPLHTDSPATVQRLADSYIENLSPQPSSLNVLAASSRCYVYTRSRRRTCNAAAISHSVVILKDICNHKIVVSLRTATRRRADKQTRRPPKI